MRPESRVPVVRVLDEDPDLGAGIDPAEWRSGVGMAVAPEFTFERGPWSFAPEPEQGSLGALILEGMILIRIDAGARSHIELLGEGDVASPWVGTGPELSTPSVVTASVVSSARVALLNRAFALRTARWPEIHAAVIQRCIVRARRLSLQSAINALPRIEERVEATLWALAGSAPVRKPRGGPSRGPWTVDAHRAADLAAARAGTGDAEVAGPAERSRALATPVGP